MTFSWRSYIDALSADVQRVYSKNGASRGSAERATDPLLEAGEKAASPPEPRKPPSTVSSRMRLTNLPAANSQNEANDIALLLLRKLLEVLKGTHFACARLAGQLLVASKIEQ